MTKSELCSKILNQTIQINRISALKLGEPCAAQACTPDSGGAGILAYFNHLCMIK